LLFEGGRECIVKDVGCRMMLTIDAFTANDPISRGCLGCLPAIVEPLHGQLPRVLLTRYVTHRLTHAGRQGYQSSYVNIQRNSYSTTSQMSAIFSSYAVAVILY
jgi:hypothetical protein